MILERLGIISDEVSADFKEAIQWISEQQLKHIEVRMVDGVNVMELTDEQLDAVMGEVEDKGLFISAISSPVFKCALDPERPVASGDTFGQEEENVASHFEKLERAFVIAKRLKTNRIRIFSFWREKNPAQFQEEIITHLRKAAKRAEEEGIELVLENEGSCNGGLAQEVGELVRAVDSPALKALWDPGNEACRGKTAYPDGYEHVKDILTHVHIKDAYVNQSGKARCVPVSTGQVAYREQFQALINDGYKGLFTIETHFTPEGGTKMDGSRMTLDNLRLLLKSMDK